jgi:Tol biopolymer transport system component
LWRMPTAQPDGSGYMTAIAVSSLSERNAQYSPDGKYVVFQSNRSGALEIWIADSDSGRARQLTYFGRSHTGTPRWSPDSEQVVFDSDLPGSFDVYVVSREGGKPRRLTDHPAEDAVPSWSADGQSIYFESTRTGRSEIWRVPVRGGSAVQVTKEGGMVAFESPDGRWLYYTRRNGPTPLWRRAISGNAAEDQVLESVFLRNFFVTRLGVYYMRPEGLAEVSIRFFDPERRVERVLGQVKQTPTLGFSVSPDDRWVLFSKNDREGMDIMLVENFE